MGLLKRSSHGNGHILCVALLGLWLLLGCDSARSSSVSAVEWWEDSNAEALQENGLRFAKYTLTDYMIQDRDDEDAQEVLRLLKLLEQNCRIDIEVHLRSESKATYGEHVYSFDFRIRRIKQLPEDVSHLGITSIPMLALPSDISIRDFVVPTSELDAKISRVHATLRTFISRALRENPGCSAGAID